MDKRIEASKQNVIHLKILLESIILKPADYLNDPILGKALCSQGGLAKYSRPSPEINASSLNTLKRTAELLFDNGFLDLDTLRIRALERLQKLSSPVPNSSARESLQKRCAQLEKELAHQKQVDLLTAHELLGCLKTLTRIVEVGDLALAKNLADKQIKRVNSFVTTFNDFGVGTPLPLSKPSATVLKLVPDAGADSE